MRVFTTDELARMQTTQTDAMQDTCTVNSYSRTFDSYGAPVASYTASAATKCGVRMNPGREVRRPDLTSIPVDMTVRLPIDTTIKATDTITITHRFGVGITNITGEIIGEIRRGPSGLQVDLQRITP